MTAELGILVIHGMGSQKRDYANDMIAELNDRVDRLGKTSGDIAWESVYWADVLEARQIQYWQDSKNDNDLDAVRLRKFMLTAFGDAGAYQVVDSDFNTTYDAIHEIVRTSVKSLYENGLGSQPKPMIILAHSLGGHIISNYIWDAHKAGDMTVSPFERMYKVSGIVTFGCNIPFFTFAYENVKPIRFPHPTLPDHLKARAKWLNFFDPDDVLGYPLRSINDAYADTVDEDNAVNVGGIFTSWNPLSHGKYWTDDDFTKPVARLIASFL